MKRTINGPNGLRIELDSSEIVPDDPGQGTPAMVYYKQYSATYWCAVDAGVLHGEEEYTLTPKQADWLNEQYPIVDAFIDKNERV